MNDYKKISGFTIDSCNSLFLENLKFLEKTIECCKDYRKIVTHHSPYMIGTSHPIHNGSNTNCGVSTDLTYLIEKIDLWSYTL